MKNNYSHWTLSHFIFLLASTLLASCGSGGSDGSIENGNTETVNPLVKLREDYVTFVNEHKSEYSTIGEGSVDIDLKGDGDSDVVVTFADSQGNKVPLYGFDNSGNGFTLLNLNVVAAAATYTVLDANGDTLQDLYLGRGIDEGPGEERGAADQLLIQQANGTMTDVSASHLPSTINDDNKMSGINTHGTCSGDVDSDGDEDIVIAGLATQHLLLNDGSGIFTDESDNLPQNELTSPDWKFSLTWCEIGDLNHDDVPDIIFGSNNQNGSTTGTGKVVNSSHIIVYGNGSGSFDYTAQSAVPNGVGQSSTVDIELLDYNQDLCVDFAVQSHLVGNTQSHVVVFEGDCAGGFEVAFISAPSGYVNNEIEVLDINGDDLDDIVTYVARGNAIGNEVFVNSGAGFDEREGREGDLVNLPPNVITKWIY